MSKQPSGVITEPFGEREAVGRDPHRPIRANEGQLRLAHRLAREEVTTEVADICVAVGGDDHVVAIAGRDLRQVGVHRELAVRLSPQEHSAPHRHDQETTVGQPPEPARPVVELDLDADVAVQAG